VSNKYKEALKQIKELVDKATPKKPLKYVDTIGLEHEYCPRCNDTQVTVYAMQPYCKMCGQKIDWSDDK
jgi:hypothetical protein